ncbi:alpha-2-macroglobulin [Simiduia litorea]
MKWMLPFLTLLLLGCNPDRSNEASIESAQPEAAFNLAQVQKDYPNTPVTVLDVSERDLDGRNAIAVTLSVPVNPKDNIQRYFSISAKGGTLVDGAWTVSKSGKTVWFPYTEPNTEYDITTYQGLEAANGQRLASNHFTSLRTRHLSPSFNFDTRGNFLSAGIGNGLPISSVNVNDINIDFFRIDSDNIRRFLQEMHERGNYYWGVDQLTQLGQLVYSGRYQLDGDKNTRTQRTIDVGNNKALKDAGVYLAVMTAAGKYDDKQLVWFAVTDLGIHARQYQNQLDVYVSSLNSGKAIESVTVRLLNAQSKLLSERTTTPDGLASFTPIDANAQLIVAQQGDHYSVIEVHKPALDLSEFDLGKRPQLPVELFIYTPRDLFRPGEIIDFNGLIRDGDGRHAAATVLNAELRSPDGSSVKTFKWQAQEAGYYHYPWQVPSNAMLGNWQLIVTGSLKQPVSYSFKVEEFLPERMKLSFNVNAESTEGERIVSQAQDDISVPVLGEYLYGAPAAGNRLSTQVFVKPWRNPVEALKNYSFGNVNEANLKQEFDLEDINLDDQGQALLNIESQWHSAQSPLQVKLISSLYESGGRPVSRAFSTLVWPHEYLLGIQAEFGDKNPEANSRVNFDLVKASLSGALASANNIDIKLIQEDRQYFWVYDSHQGWHYEWTDKEFVEQSRTIDLSDEQPTRIQLPLNYGSYRLEASDPASGQMTSIRFYAGYDWYSRWQDSQSGDAAARPDKVIIAQDKAHYRAGDTAQVNILPPNAGEALIMVESDGPLWMKRISVRKEGTTIGIPIDKNWRQHNLYVTALVLQPGQQKNLITPTRSFGLAHLALDRSERKLAISLDVAEKILPEQTYNVELEVSSSGANTNDNVFVTLAAVDVGVLSISNFQTPDPFTHFFGQRRYNVDSRDIYGNLIDVSNAAKAQLRFGGDSDISRGGKEPQSEVQIVSLFSGLVKLENGKASIPLQIPDFNGRLRLMAVAFSDQAFGHSETEITVAAPIVTQLSLPRFLALGDTSSLALDVHNLSGAEQTLDIQLSADGPVNLSAGAKTIVLADKAKATLLFPIEGTGFSGAANISLTVSGNATEAFTRHWQLGVRPAYPAVVQQDTKTLNNQDVFQLDGEQIKHLLPESVQASVSASAQVNLNIDSQLQNLLAYPYGCLEQTSSRAYPLTFASRENQQRFHLPVIEDAKRFDMIQKGIDHIATMQLSNGGFGLWSNSSSEEHWLTAYVADFLLNARAAGIAVAPELIDKTLRRLTQYISRSGSFVDQRWSEDSRHYTFAYKAYAAYVLAQVNQAPLGALRSLHDNQRSHAKTGLAKVQLGLALLRMGDATRGHAAIKEGLQTKTTGRQYYGDYGSDIRDTAMVIHLLLENNLFTAEAATLSFSLAQELRSQDWLSTQERNALFLAGISLQTHLANSWQAKVILGAAETAINQDSRYQKNLNSADLISGFSITSLNDKPIFVASTISGYSKTKPAAHSNGLQIERTWYDKSGQPVQPHQVSVGDLFIVHLRVSADKRTPDALVVDLLPAGFELENQNLDSAIKLDNFSIDQQPLEQLINNTQLKHQEYRDDRYVAALDVNHYQAAHLFYLMRAVTPGSYQVPSPLVEDMYRPERRGLGETFDAITIKNVAK